MTKIAYTVKIRGKVTGVAFRWSAKAFADKLPSICGYIKNNSCFEVEAFIQGDKNEIEKFLQFLRKGPVAARVNEFLLSDSPLSKVYKNFSIK